MKKFLLMFVRHGETNGNIQRVFQAHDTPLNECGQTQAYALGKFLHKEKFTHIYSSDLARTKQTCEIIMSQNTHYNSSAQIVQINHDKRLRERDFGTLRGSKYEEYDKFVMNSSTQDFMSCRPPMGESILDVSERCKEFFIALCKQMFIEKNTNESDIAVVANVLVVTHGAFLQIMFSYLRDELGCQFEWGNMLNTGRSCFEVTFPSYADNDLKVENNSEKPCWFDDIIVKNTLINVVC